ncbi:MAG: DUF4352 domain-containing protein [Actinomycetota bacterium]|nr:DUF4352 domain-containing protein [Actinomycetota bacterium]
MSDTPQPPTTTRPPGVPEGMPGPREEGPVEAPEVVVDGETWVFTDPVESAIPTRRNPWPVVGAALVATAALLLLLAVALGLLAGGGDADDDVVAPDLTQVTSVAVGAEDGASECDPDPADTANLCLYPERDDRRRTDHEAELGTGVRIGGIEAAATGARTATNDAGEEVVVVDVDLRDLDAADHTYNLFDWHLLTTDGEVVEPFGVPPADAAELSSGELTRGETVSGTITFESRPGPFYVVYQPRLIEDGRGIWQVEAADG